MASPLPSHNYQPVDHTHTIKLYDPIENNPNSYYPQPQTTGDRQKLPDSRVDEVYGENYDPPIQHPATTGLHSRQRFYWLSPMIMGGSFLAALGIALAHHFYYAHLEGRVVGDLKDQQWPLRLGTALAFLFKTAVTASVGVAYTQWVWKTLRHKYLSIGSIDAAFIVRTSVLSLFNYEMISKMKIASMIALMLWLLPLPSLVTPATLSVKPSHSRTFESLSVPNLQINQYLNATTLKSKDSMERYYYISRFVEFFTGNAGEKVLSTGPSTRLSQMMLATASTGQLFQKPRPVSSVQGGNLTYQIETISPGIRCGLATKEEADETLVAAYTSMSNELYSSNITIYNSTKSQLTYTNKVSDSLYTTYHLYYFAMVPSPNETAKHPQPLPLTLERSHNYQEYNTSLANRLWIIISPGNGSSNVEPTFLSCQLWNVSYSFNISFSSEQQTTKLTNTKYLNTVQPMMGYNDSLRNSGEGYNYIMDQGDTIFGQFGANAARMTYTMFFLALCKQITGSIYTVNYARGNDQVTDGGIQNTVLTGSTDYYSALIKGQNGEYGNEPLAQGIQQTNKTLSSMIEELAANVTSNMLGSSYFSMEEKSLVTINRPQNVYSYDPRNLVLAYGIGLAVCFLILILGAIAYHTNGAVYDSYVSSIIRAAQNPDLSKLAQPSVAEGHLQAQDIQKIKLRFGIVNILTGPNTESRPGFGLEGTVMPLNKKNH